MRLSRNFGRKRANQAAVIGGTSGPTPTPTPTPSAPFFGAASRAWGTSSPVFGEVA